MQTAWCWVVVIVLVIPACQYRSGEGTSVAPRRLVVRQAGRKAEVELVREIERLDARALALTHVAALRWHHQRSIVLAIRDDDQPRRRLPLPLTARDGQIARLDASAERATELDVSSTEPQAQRFTDDVATQLAAMLRLRLTLSARLKALRARP